MQGEQSKDPIVYLLELLSSNFSYISQYDCRQYFQLFCLLIDIHFRSSSHKTSFNPKNLLSQVIDHIALVNDLMANSPSPPDLEEQERLYIGLLSLTSKIIDNFDIAVCEQIVQEKGLIDEIFVRFLFASVFANNTGIEDKPVMAIQDKQAKQKGFGPKCKEQAFQLLLSLIGNSQKLMLLFLSNNLWPLM